MILDALMAACFFAAVVAMLSVPWMCAPGNPGEHQAAEHD